MTTIEKPTGEQVRVPDLPAPAGRAGPGRRLRRLVAFVLAFLFFFGPALAALVGIRPDEFENRRLAAFPSLDTGWRFFGDFKAWSTDHLPLRAQAVEANTWLSETVFSETPSYDGRTTAGGPLAAGVPADGEADPAVDPKQTFPRVVPGEDGWLYLGSDFANPCHPELELDEVMTRLARLHKAVTDSGRRFLLVVAPDKSTIVDEYLPGSYLGKDCAGPAKDAFWSRLREDPPPGYIDLREPLERLQEETGRPAYRQTDTHWTPLAATVYGEQLADALDPQLWAATEVRVTGEERYRGDLGVLLGQPQQDSFQAVQVLRPGVQRVEPLSDVRVANVSTDAPLYQPRTLLLGDSFTAASRPAVYPLFESLTVLHPELASSEPDAVVRQVLQSEVVVFESVERTLISGETSLLDPAFLDRLEQALAEAG